MSDSTESDGQAEIVMDYVISWCLRFAQKDNGDKPILHKKCIQILKLLLGIDKTDVVEFTLVNTWKQHKKIDIWAEVNAIVNGQAKSYSLLIEDKYYSGLRTIKDGKGFFRNQLDVYKEKFDRYYDEEKNDFGANRRYVLITCISRSDPKIKIYSEHSKYGFELFTYDELVEDNEETESDIYNEFFIRWNTDVSAVH